MQLKLKEVLKQILLPSGDVARAQLWRGVYDIKIVI